MGPARKQGALTKHVPWDPPLNVGRFLSEACCLDGGKESDPGLLRCQNQRQGMAVTYR